MTNLLTESATATETILKSGKPAPFSGVLVNEKTYRGYVANEFEVKNLRNENLMLSTQADGLMQREIEAKRDEPNVYIWFLSGVILGTAAGFSAAK